MTTSTTPAPAQTSRRPRGFIAATLSFVAVFAAGATPIPLYDTYARVDGLTSAEFSLVAVAYFVQNRVGLRLHRFRARIVVLVNAVAEARKAEIVVLVLRLFNVFGDAIDGADLLQHLQCGFIGAAMRGPPEARDTGCNTRERIGARRTRETHG